MHMTEDKEYLRIPGHVPVKEAAEMLGISEDRVLQHIKAERLPARKVDGRYMILKEAVERFQLNPPGRVRTRTPEWRIYNTRNKLLALEIQANVRPGRQEALLERLKRFEEGQLHIFPGTNARYILKNNSDTTFDAISVWLFWRDTEMPPEQARQEALVAFKSALEDLVEWGSARIVEREGIIYT
jgi:excisionase family DNA binding protein